MTARDRQNGGLVNHSRTRPSTEQALHAGGVRLVAGLPWVRLDANIASHDKILALLETKPAATAYQAAFSYVCALGYAGGHGTDGLVEFTALRFIHGTKTTAKLLVENFLWTPDRLGWRIVNFDKRQQMTATTKQIKTAQRAGALRANCVRWHGAECGCWEGAA